MSRMVTIDEDKWQSVLKRIHDLETATPLFAASVTSGRVRIGGTATLLVDSSGGIVVHGSIDGDGEFTWTGTLNADGTITLNGPVSITGATSVTGDMTVEGAGVIKVGDVTLSPSVTAGGGAGGLSAPVVIPLDAPVVAATGSMSVADDLDATNLDISGYAHILGTLTNPGITNKSGVVANVYVDGAGRLFRAI